MKFHFKFLHTSKNIITFARLFVIYQETVIRLVPANK